MEPTKIVIFDYNEDKLYILDYDKNLYHNIEDFFLTEEVIEADLNIQDCECIIVAASSLQILFTLN